MKLKLVILIALAILAGGIVLAQRTAREAEDRQFSPPPSWTNDPEFAKDVFTFVRAKYTVNGKWGYGHSNPKERWAIDFPDGDLILSFRLQQMTSMKVDPDGLALAFTDKELFEYPFIYIVEAGKLTFEDDEIAALRKYLLNGGFMMVDDFWGDQDWRNFEEELKLLFPDREAVELPNDHPIFHGIFSLAEKPQIPNVKSWERGRTYDRLGAGSEEAHYRAILDDKKRIMILICHNTDLGDGWEQEGSHEEYFHRFSEKQAYPLGINIIFYAMTH